MKVPEMPRLPAADSRGGVPSASIQIRRSPTTSVTFCPKSSAQMEKLGSKILVPEMAVLRAGLALLSNGLPLLSQTIIY